MTPTPVFYAVIPAGGSGTRLWPLSRASTPKFLHDLTGTGSTLLQTTWSRLTPLAGPEHTVVVTGEAHAASVRGQLPDLKGSNLLREPAPRDSAAAICLAASLIVRRDPDAVIGSFAADHVITDVPAFHAVVREAIAVAAEGWVTTVGITPGWPATGFGYIRRGEALGLPAAPRARRVTEFVEKPDADTATRYVESGGYDWNAGMFIVRASVLLDLLAEHQPGLYRGLQTIASAWATPRRHEVIAEIWPQLPTVAIDYAVAEPAALAGRVAVVGGDFGWDDVGDFAAVARLRRRRGGTGPGRGESVTVSVRPQPEDGAELPVTVLGDAAEVLSFESDGIVVRRTERLVAVLGLDDVIVVDTPDALLVSSRQRAQDVKKVVQALHASGKTGLV